MIPIRRDSGGSLIPLDLKSAIRLLETASRSHAPVHLSFARQSDGHGWDGALVRADLDGLTVQINKPTEKGFVFQSLGACVTELRVEHEVYFFDTAVLAQHDTPDGTALEMVYPRRVHLRQRRRHRRVYPHDRVAVQVSHADGFSAWCACVSLLNVSPYGLAGVAEREEADLLHIGDVLGLRFHLEPEDRPFDFKAVVRSKTAMPEAESVIVGFSFQTDYTSKCDRERLRDVVDSLNVQTLEVVSV